MIRIRLLTRKFIYSLVLLTFVLTPVFSFGAIVPHKDKQQVVEQSLRKLLERPHTNEILVQYKKSDHIQRIKVEKADDFEKILRRYLHNPAVEFAEPNYKLFVSGTTKEPNDFFYKKNQTYLSQINMPGAWKESVGERDVIVAVLDAGVDIYHEDLSRNIWVNVKEVGKNNKDDDKNNYIDDVNGYDFVEHVGDPSPKADTTSNTNFAGLNHGTVVAGLIGAVGNNTKGISGVNWKVRIMPLRVLSTSGEGSVATVVEGLEYAMKHKARVVNMSFVGYERSEALDRIIEKAYKRGLVIVAAAGNALPPSPIGIDLDERPSYPACSNIASGHNEVLGVSALDRVDKVTFFSNFGSQCIDVSAPGLFMFSTQTVNKKLELTEPYGDSRWSGTSFAAPLVSGVSALLLSIDSTLTNVQIYRFIRENGDDLDVLNPGYAGKLGTKLNAARVSVAVAQAKAEKVAAAKPESKMKLSKKARLRMPRVGSISFGADGASVHLFNNEFTLVRIISGDVSTLSQGSQLLWGELTGDKNDDLVVYGASGAPVISVFDARGKRLARFNAFDGKTVTAMSAVLGDVNGDGIQEIIVAPRNKTQSMVRIFSFEGKKLSEFVVYDTVKVGLNLATGNLDGDNHTDIIVGTSDGGGPQVSIYDMQGELKSRFFADEAALRGGVLVTAGDIDGDGIDNVITFAPKSGELLLMLWKELGVSANRKMIPLAAPVTDLYAGDMNFDGFADLFITGADNTRAGGVVLNHEGIFERKFDNQSLGIVGRWLPALLQQ